MTDIDETMLIALVDGELDEVSRRRIERAVAEDPALAARLDMHVRLRERLADHYAPIEAEPVPAAMRALLQAEAKVVPSRSSGGGAAARLDDGRRDCREPVAGSWHRTFFRRRRRSGRGGAGRHGRAGRTGVSA